MEAVFNNKRVCVVMTCNLPEYSERLCNIEKTIQQIQLHDFIVVYLFAEPNNDNAIRIKHDAILDRYSMYVPLEETYSNLPQKMYMCFQFFNQLNVCGILKIDDDIVINDNAVFDTKCFTCDYMGADMCSLKGGNKYPISSKSSETFNLDIGENTIYYFAGPYYWVSKNAINVIVNTGILSPWEDVNVGYALSQWNNCKVLYPKWYRSEAVWWP